jgi:membrane-associated protease RseP (regulator of RpoE activity)
VRPDPSSFDPGGWSTGVFSVPRPEYTPRWWLHWLLLALTLVTTTFWGAVFVGDPPDELLELPWQALVLHPLFILEGFKFSIPLLLILATHEMGHYVACRQHRLLATPPFFVPFPLPIGTLGAVIRIKEPIRTRRQLLDVGAAGPIAGFVAAVPFMIVGLILSRTQAIPEPATAPEFIMLGEPLVYRLLQTLTMPTVAGDMTVILHPTAFAAWCGVLVTLLNLLPFAQLDGGHVSYALFGRWHRQAAWPMLAVLVMAGALWFGWWVWSVIVLVMGVHHPPVWDETERLGAGRVLVGLLCIAIFVLCFMPVPLQVAQ